MNSKSELKRLCAQDPVGMTKKILELEQRVKVLTDAMRFGREELRACQAVIHLAGGFDPAYVNGAQAAMKQMDAALNATPQQTAAQIERWHREWLMKQPVSAWNALGKIVASGPDDYPVEVCVKNGCTPLYQIPPLPKESDSPETGLDEALRRQ